MSEPDTREDAFPLSPITIGGYDVSPITYSTYRILLRTKNAMVGGGADTEEAGIAALQEFLFIHCKPLSDVLASINAGTFSDDALLFCAAFSLEEMNAVSEQIQQAAGAIEDGTAEPAPEPGKPKPQPVTNRAG